MTLDESDVNETALMYFRAATQTPSIRIKRMGDEVRVKCGRIRNADGVFVRVYDGAGNREYVQKGYGFGKYGVVTSDSPLSPAFTSSRQQLTIPLTSSRILGGRRVRKVEAVTRGESEDDETVVGEKNV